MTIEGRRITRAAAAGACALLGACSAVSPRGPIPVASGADGPRVVTPTPIRGAPGVGPLVAATPIGGAPGVGPLVAATPIGGAPGVGPLVAPPPVTAPGGRPVPQQVVLADRTLTVNGVTAHKATAGPTTVLDVGLTVHNLAAGATANDTTFFTVIGSDGDTFGPTSASAGFSGDIAAGGDRRGTLDFQVPSAVASSLRLLYRPADGAASVLVQLPLG